MTFDVTHQQAIDRGMLRHYLADTINLANTVRTQPNLNPAQREAVERLLVAANETKSALGAGK